MRRYMNTLIRALQHIVAAATALSALHAFAAANSIESVDVSSQPGDKVLVRIKMKSPAVKPTGFTVTTPPRIALDFPDVSSNLSNPNIPAGQGNLRAVNVVESGGRSRLVISLVQSASYEVTTSGNDVLVTVNGPSGSTATTASSPVTRLAEPQPSSNQDSIRDIEFRKGKNGEGRVIVDLTSSNPGVDIRQQGRQLLVDLTKVTLPANLRRRLDVTDFGTSVVSIDAKPTAGGAQLVIEPKGIWGYSAYQTDGKLVVEVKEENTNSAQPEQKTYTGEKLSLNFQNVEVRSVLAVLADFTGLNIITSDTVTGNLTLRLKDVPWDQAFDIVLQAKGLDSRRKGNVILVAPRDELATKEKLALEANQSISELEPTRSETFQINYQKVKTVADFLKDEKNRFLSKRGTAIGDERTNQLIVSDIPSKLEDIRALLQKIDKPTKQVMIEARIVVADDKFSYQLGSRVGLKKFGTTWGGDRTVVGVGGSGDSAREVYNDLFDASKSGTDRAIKILGTGDYNVNLPAAAAPSIGLSLFRLPSNFILNLELSALELDNRGKVVSSPRVVTADQEKATIKQGTRVPQPKRDKDGNITVDYVDATLTLEVTPQITPDNRVVMELQINKDKLGATINGFNAIDTNSITTKVLVANGETTVIGGIFEETTRNDVSKVPLLGDIPFLGFLFRNTAKRDDKVELLIFITPRILDEQLAVR